MSGSLDHALLRWLNEIAAHGIFTTDAALRIEGWNRWLELHTGRAAADLIGRPLMDAFPELERRGFGPYYAEALRGQVHVISQALHGHLLSMRARLGNRTLPEMPQTARIAPLTEDDRVVGTITVIEDVSERALRETELRNRIDELAEAKRRADAAVLAKDQFLATLSHELRTPLTSVMGWTRILRRSDVDLAQIARGLEIIERNAVSQVRLIDDLLDMSRILNGKLRIDAKPVDLAGVVQAAVDVSMPAASAKGVVLRLNTVPRLPFVGDAERLQQIVWNLVSNAVKFTPESGTVDVELTVENGTAAVITVRDTGKGIEAEFLPLIFHRFRQADASSSRQHSGLGIGLALVHELVELHGGSVRAQSAGLGQGTTLSVRFPLPARSDGGGAAATAPPAGHVAPLAEVAILVVDDEPDTREMLRSMLASQGASVRVAGSCEDALDALAFPPTARQQTQLILSDLAMPGEDGYALLACIRADARFNDIVAIALTAHAGPEERERALEAGFAAYLVKPVDLDTLTTAILRAIALAERSRGRA